MLILAHIIYPLFTFKNFEDILFPILKFAPHRWFFRGINVCAICYYDPTDHPHSASFKFELSIFSMHSFRSNFWRRIRIRNQNQPITSGFWDIWGYVLEKWGFSLLLRLCTGRKKFFWFFSQMSQMSSFSTTPFPSKWAIKQSRAIFSHKDTAISRFDIYQNNLISIPIDSLTFPFLRWRIEIYKINRFRSLKTLTRGFRHCWLRKWGRKIDIFIYKMAGRFKMANWNLRGKQYWSLKFCTWEYFASLSTNACVQYAKFFLCVTQVNFHESFYWSSINKLKFLRVRKFLESEIV